MALAVLAARQPGIDWWRAIDTGGGRFQALAVAIGRAAPGFREALDEAQVAQGLPPGRPPLPPMAQADCDRLLAETVDRHREELSSDEREARIRELLARGADPNTTSRRVFHGQHTTLVGAAVAEWQPELFELLMQHEGRVEPQAFSWLACSTLVMMEHRLLLGQAVGPDMEVHQQRLLAAKAAVEQHGTIDWEQLTPAPCHCLIHDIEALWGGPSLVGPDRTLISILADHFPAFAALQQEWTMQTQTGQAQGPSKPGRRL